jgi:hypothetical protein
LNKYIDPRIERGIEPTTTAMNPEDARPSYRDADMSRVDVGDPYAVRWWCQRFVCTESMLRAAVGAVGARSGDVEGYLKGRPGAPRPRARKLAAFQRPAAPPGDDRNT